MPRAFTYDANGNMLSRKTTEQKPEDPQNTAFFVLEKSSGGPNTLTQYAYNGFNQLKASNDGISAVAYAYDGNGSRVEKTVTTGPKASPEVKTTRYLYEKDKVILEVDGNGTEVAKNTYGTNLLSREMANVAVYYMYNGHGDVTALLSTDGTQVASYYYDIWGNLQEKTESEQIRNPYRYSGYQFDEETGLYYLNARYYDSSIARFITEDTYTGEKNDPLSLNQYTYCHNDPIRYDDPTGHVASALYEADGNVRVDKTKGTAKSTTVTSKTNSSIQLTNDSTINRTKAEAEEKAKDQALQSKKASGQKAAENKPTNNITVTVKRQGIDYNVPYTPDNYQDRMTALNVGLYSALAVGLGTTVGVAGGVKAVITSMSAGSMMPDFQVDVTSLATNLASKNYPGAYIDAIAVMTPGVSSSGVTTTLGKTDNVLKPSVSNTATKFVEDGSATFKSNEEAMKYYSILVEKLNVNTGKNQAVFYSGPGNRQLAEQFAKENGKLTLEMTPGGKYLDNLKLFDSNSPLTGDQAAEIWGKLSRRYAENASGTAFGFTQGSRPGSIFNTVEYPALEGNKNIVNVITEFLNK